jgi:hypothetical protein
LPHDTSYLAVTGVLQMPWARSPVAHIVAK